MRDHPDPAQDQGTRHGLGDVGFGHEHASELGPGEPRHQAVLGHPGGDQDLAVVEQVELAGELARMKLGEHAGRRARAVVDLDRPLVDQEEVDRAVVAPKQGGVSGQALDAAEGADALDLVGTQHGIGLLEPAIGIALSCRRAGRIGRLLGE